MNNNNIMVFVYNDLNSVDKHWYKIPVRTHGDLDRDNILSFNSSGITRNMVAMAQAIFIVNLDSSLNVVKSRRYNLDGGISSDNIIAKYCKTLDVCDIVYMKSKENL